MCCSSGDWLWNGKKMAINQNMTTSRVIVWVISLISAKYRWQEIICLFIMCARVFLCLVSNMKNLQWIVCVIFIVYMVNNTHLCALVLSYVAIFAIGCCYCNRHHSKFCYVINWFNTKPWSTHDNTIDR